MKSRVRRPRWVALLLAVATGAVAPAAHAHLVTTGLGPVYDGILHFVLTLEDLIPALALSIYAGLRGREHARIAMFALPIAWLAAGVAGVMAAREPTVTPDWLPFVLLGGLVAADLSLPRAGTAVLAVALGAALGYQNGVVMSVPDGPGLRGVLGTAATVFVVVTLLAALVSRFQAGGLRIAWRVLGSWIAATGLLLFGWSLVS